MSKKEILVPTDFSSSADAALGYASSLARGMGASLQIVHVKMEPALYGPCDDEQDPAEPHLHTLLKRSRPPDLGVSYEHHFLRSKGNPGEEILRFAETHNVQMIVMGAHGETCASGRLMGTVAELVVGRSAFPVLTINQPVESRVTS
jgi:nucleotide-binding universal stress UspA family protein